MKTKIGYLIPEFPGQTHAFFMRERAKLTALGVDADLVSTRPPRNGQAQHAWADKAAAETTYLSPMTLAPMVSAAIELIRSGPFGWLRAAGTVLFSPNLSLKQRMKLALFIPAGARLKAIARANGWKHIHVHSCANAANVAMFANRLGGIEYSMTLHGPLKDYGPNQQSKWQHSAFDVIITEDLIAEANQQIGDSLPDRIFLAPMGVEVDRFCRTNDYSPASRTDIVQIVSCGRINPCKGHDDLIRAIAELKTRGIECQLNICGATDSNRIDYRDSLLNLAQELGVEDKFQLLGSVSELEVRDELQKSHFFCLASHKEPLGVATMEAMAMELPCIVTNSPGVSEMIQHETDGVLVPAHNPSAFADAIENMLDNPFAAQQIASRGRATVCERFHSGVSAEVIRDGVAGRQPQPRIQQSNKSAESGVPA